MRAPPSFAEIGVRRADRDVESRGVVGWSRLSIAAKAYFGGVVLVGLTVLGLGWVVHPIALVDLPTLVYLGIGVQVAALMPIRWKNSSQQVHDPLLLAAGLFTPGAGVALLAWLALYDGRRPGRDIPWWAVFFNRAMYAITYGLPSIGLSFVHFGGTWQLPLKTLLYALAAIAINYPLTARAVAFVVKAPMWQTLRDNVGLVTVGSMLVLCFSGGILYQLLQTNVGYFMAPGLFGFLVAVRGNVADAQRQSEARQQTLELAAQALDARDPYTESHSARVAQLAVKLGETLQLGGRMCDQLRTAGTLHDLGKIGIRDHILNKADSLTADEWVEMKKHPDIGADMIKKHSALAPIAPLVRHHHERWDGSGYPARLVATEIPFGARILAVADTYDTITTARVYRNSAMSPREAVEHISGHYARWYDPAVVNALRIIHGLAPIADPRTAPSTGGTRLLANPQFVRLLSASTISALGDPLTVVATLVSIYSATRDPRAVAFAYVVQALATIVIGGVLGGMADRVNRRRLVVVLESARAALLLATPFLLARTLWAIFPILVILASINALTQPSRQAAIAESVREGSLGRANAMVTGASTLAGAIGFPLAAMIMWITASTNVLFAIDALTFTIAALLMVGIGHVGGGIRQTDRLGGAIRTAFAVRPIRVHLLMVALAAFFLSMSYPALVSLSYAVSSNGAQTFTWLEAALGAGVVFGSVLVGRLANIGSMRTVVLGILITGVFSLAISASAVPLLIGGFLFIASIGNPIYTVGNQTALLNLTPRGSRGSVMVTRFAVTQVSLIVGSAFGGILTQAVGAEASYAVIGVGLIGVALVGVRTIIVGESSSPVTSGEVALEHRLLVEQMSVAPKNPAPN